MDTRALGVGEDNDAEGEPATMTVEYELETAMAVAAGTARDEDPEADGGRAAGEERLAWLSVETEEHDGMFADDNITREVNCTDKTDDVSADAAAVAAVADDEDR